jgi:hypothetical protein
MEQLGDCVRKLPAVEKLMKCEIRRSSIEPLSWRKENELKCRYSGALTGTEEGNKSFDFAAQFIAHIQRGSGHRLRVSISNLTDIKEGQGVRLCSSSADAN